ncbi:uncharacterized protein M421DRAFT_51181 [Didymella exigua CBS 183.55]|uniref:Uncharacterized protein n=1 Tax=Didymella exigua CBS 183.55 TaxID=1150837 RepID=A0A6A5S309_9PLEO|nr:uncharacterized protein M421DRAFT_51181 [Didymella exigua CBS 183.55]KAF1933824.1 hypothetical protein M421DRAFT_51181 [Didymella exigua CBS 183.55]
MAPLRRYLRITKHSVLEVRVYLDRPADAEAWLLKRDDPALPRVIQAIRPLVLPKLREENERGKVRAGAKAKKKGVKDVVVEGRTCLSTSTTANFTLDDFEVSIFLTELSSRHSVMTKQKMFQDKSRIQSNSGKLTSWLTTGTSDHPMVINELEADPRVIEGDDDDAVNLADIPEAPKRSTRAKRDRTEAEKDAGSQANESDEENLFIPETTSKRSKTGAAPADAEVVEDESQDDKKKLGLNTSYEGFSIYGRILCLVVKRRGVRNAAGGATAPVSSQQMLENWVSTQAAGQAGDDDEDNG